MDDLRAKINDLKFLLESGDFSPGDSYYAKDVAENIKLICDEVQTTSVNFTYFLSMLFSQTEEDSLFVVLKQFLKLSANNVQQFDDAISTCVDALTMMILKAETGYLDKYASEIVQFSLKVIRQEALKSKRESGYTLLISVLEIMFGKIDDEELRVEDVVKICYLQIETLKKTENTGVKKGLYQLMGILCKLFPDKLTQTKRNYGSTFAAVLAAEMKSQMASSAKAPAYAVLGACFDGFNGILCNFSDALETGGKITLRQLYDYCKIVCDPDNKQTRHAPHRAALMLLIDHAVLFRPFFLPEFKALYGYFQFWAMHSDRELRTLGFKGTDALLQQIAEGLPEQLKKNVNDGKRIYDFFVDKFNRSLLQSTGVREVALSVKGLGYFAAATKVLDPTGGRLLNLMKTITNRSENIFLNSPEPLEQKVTYVQYFLDAIASVMTHLDEVPIDVWAPLETLHVLLYQHFPLLDKKYYYSAVLVTCRVFIAASSRNFTYLERIIHQSLIRLFSLSPVAVIQSSESSGGDSSLTDNRDPKNFVYKDYLPLWTILIKGTGLKSLDDDDVKMICDQLFNSTLRICLDVISRLDLESQKISLDDDDDETDELSASSQPLLKLKPKKRNDFWIFINLVDFLRDLLTPLKLNRFEKWIPLFVRSLIECSTKYPLVSGFYKLISLSLSLAEGLNYFDDSNENSMEKRNTLSLLSRFIQEVLIHMRQFKDDLLLSCLQLILKLPISIIAGSLQSYAESIKSSLKLGLTYLPLAENCMDALEIWNKFLPLEQLKSFYSEILPCLDEYLKSEHVGTVENESVGRTEEKTTTRRRRKKGVDKKNIVEQKKSFKDLTSKVAESKLTNIRSRILLFVGSLGGEINHRLIGDDPKQLAEMCTVWDTKIHLEFAVPFVDMKPTIVLDKFLPRLCILATSSSDRRTKIAACESLHSIVLFMIGKSSEQNRRERSPMHHIYRRLFPVLLQLCCDADEVPKNLFRTLTDQIIHWFSSNVSYENPETMALLDSLLTGAENASNAVVRDYSALCVNEFMKWSIKHSTKDKPMENNIRSLLKRLYALASHPSCVKRLASSLIFNSIYRTFREENNLVSVFTLELLFVYLNSLALADQDDESEGTVEQCVEVIEHLQRILVKKKDVFLKIDAARRVPTGWSGATLEACLRWLFEQIGRIPAIFRRKCFELFESLSPFVVTIGGARQFFNSIVRKHGEKYINEKFEGRGNIAGESSIARQPSFKIDGETTLDDVFRWLKSFLACLDCYFATLQAGYVDAEILFTQSNLKEIKLFSAINFYCDSIVSKELNSIVSGVPVFTPREIKKFNELKCSVFVRLLQFYTALLNKNGEPFLQKLPNFLWPRSLFERTILCCMNPSEFGFDLSLRETVVHLPVVLRQWITAVGDRLPKNVKQTFSTCLEQFLSKEFQFVTIDDGFLSKSNVDWILQDNLVKGYSLLFSCKVLPSSSIPDGSELWRNFVDVCFVNAGDVSYAREWTPTSLNFVKVYLKFLCELGVKPLDIVIAITDSTAVKLNPSLSTTNNFFVNRGLTFLDQFGESVALFAAKNAQKFVCSLKDVGERQNFGVILCKLADVISKDVSLRKTYGENFVKAIVDNCAGDVFSRWVSSDASDLQSKIFWLTVVQKLAVIESKVFTTSTDVSDEIFECFLRLLTDKSTNLNFKVKVLNLLGLFGVCGENRSAKLKSALNDFVVREFPLKSTEFSKGTQESDDYLTAIRRMLIALSICHNSVILEVLINVLCRENEHVAEEEISNLLKSYARSVSIANWESVISVPFNVFWSENVNYTDEHRLNALEKLLLPMLNGSDANLLKHFLLKHLMSFVEKLEQPLAQVSDAIYKRQLVLKFGCWNVLEIMYTKLNAAVLKGEINDKFCGKISQDKTELIKKLFPLMQEARKEGKYDTNLSNLKWRYRCAAHNCLVAVSMATQTKAVIFDSYIFKDAWDCLVELGKKYEFDVDVDSLPYRRKQILTLRSLSTSDDEKSTVRPSRSNSTLHFLSSQFLADSSLRSDVTNYDFTASFVGSSSATTQILDEENSQSVSAYGKNSTQNNFESQSSTADINEISMDMEIDELNLHPSMKVMVAAIKFIIDKNITPIKTETGGVAEMPGWMKFMLKQLESSDVNVKLFVARLITLLEDIFSYYAKQFLTPLLRLFMDDCGTNGLHVFRIDLLATLLGWSKKAIPEQNELSKLLCSEVLEYFMIHCPSVNSAVVRRNMQILDLMLQLWNGRFVVDPNILLKYLTSADKNESNINVGIQLLGVLLRNKLNPLGNCGDEAKKTKLYGSLASHIENKSSKIYKLASEVVGLALQHLSDEEGVSSFADHVENIFRKFSNTAGVASKSKFLECLRAVQRHYAKFSDRFLKDVINFLPSVHGDYKTYCLEIICGRAGIGGAAGSTTLFDDLKTKGLKTLLVIRDEGRQLWTLQILLKIVDRLKSVDVVDVVGDLELFVDHPNAECRFAACEIFFRLYDVWNQSDSSTDDSIQILDACREVLLKLLNDEEPAIRQIVYNFWSHETRLSTDTTKRLSNVLRLTYNDKTEREFLAHATYLLLELTSKSPDFRLPVFNQPLTECKFEDFKLVTSWKRRYASLQTPAFADSQAYALGGSTLESNFMTGGPRELRATMANPVQFTQTQINSGKTYDWMTGGLYDTFADTLSTLTNDEGGETLSNLLFKSPKKSARRLVQLPKDFGQKRLTAPTTAGAGDQADDDDAVRNELKRLKRRILKDRTQSSYFFARMESRRKQIREKLDAERKVAREQNVSLYRTYRIGDFPDIQIANSALITPLQAVSQRDSIFAGFLFESLMSSICCYIEKEGDDTEFVHLTSGLARAIEDIFQSTTIFYGPLISSLMTFCYNNAGNVRIDVNDLKTASISGRQQRFGVVLLEKYLATAEIVLEPKQPPEKRQRRERADNERTTVDSLWIELSNVYKSLSDNENVRCIFSRHLNTKDLTKKALEFEANGRFDEAIDFYGEALRKYHAVNDPLTKSEKDCWTESRVHCLNELNNWKDLSIVVERTIDDQTPPDLTKVWNDQYLQDFYLPYLFRGTLKLLMKGDLEQRKTSSFFNFIDQSLNDADKKFFLQERYSLYLTLISFVKRDYEKSKYDCVNLQRKILRDWATLSWLDYGAKKHLLQESTTLAEMTKFLNFQDQKDVTVEKLVDLMNSWLNRSPNFISDNVNIWDDVIQMRSLCTEVMCERFARMGFNEDSIYRKTLPVEIRMKLQYARSASLQRRFPVAFSQLELTQKMFNMIRSKENNRNLPMEICTQYAEIQFSFLKSNDRSFSAENVERLTSVADLCEKFNSVIDKQDQDRLLLLKARVVEKLGWTFDKCEAKFLFSQDLPTDVVGKLKKICDVDISQPRENTIANLIDSAFKTYKNAIAVGLPANSLQPIIDFCDSTLRRYENDAKKYAIDADNYACCLVETLLTSLNDGSTDARRMFPRLLQILETFPCTSKSFVNLSDSVPCWMFLGWLNQIVALLDKSYGVHLFNIVEKIADEYPKALVYPFLLSRQSYRFDGTTKKQKEFVEKLATKMNNVPFVKSFIDNLALLSTPDVMIKDQYFSVHDFLSQKLSDAELKEILKESYRELLFMNHDSSWLGDFWKTLLKTWKETFEKKLGENFENFILKPKEKSELLNNFAGVAADCANNVKLPSLLEQYSVWLSQFSSDKYGAVLEIPGQYTGDRKPLPANHVFIYGFESKVKIFTSKAKPKSLTILGNDGREYCYMVKSGEDLRQDQRIMQIFDQMNAVLAKDPDCRRCGASVKTYAVVPLTTKMGLIEIVSDVESLRDFMYKSLEKDDMAKLSKEYIIEHYLGKKFYPGLSVANRKNPSFELYYESYEKVPHKDVGDLLLKAQNSVKPFLLRNEILKLCSSPDAFYVLRNRFTVSHSTLCMAHYLLGVGDRHLTNFMIETTSATMVGIDFGYVFGISVQQLQVAELMPFRLTKQITDVFLPVGVYGLPESTMCYCLRAFRENSKLLLNTMDIFVKEPALNWLQEAKRHLTATNTKPEKGDDFSWYPRQKLETVRRKFNGDNPVVVIEQELRSARTKQKFRGFIYPLEKTIEVVYGKNKLTESDKKSPRGYPKEHLTVEQQVKCLIEMAMDPVLLARVYHGWEPWM